MLLAGSMQLQTFEPAVYWWSSCIQLSFCTTSMSKPWVMASCFTSYQWFSKRGKSTAFYLLTKHKKQKSIQTGLTWHCKLIKLIIYIVLHQFEMRNCTFYSTNIYMCKLCQPLSVKCFISGSHIYEGPVWYTILTIWS